MVDRSEPQMDEHGMPIVKEADVIKEGYLYK